MLPQSEERINMLSTEVERLNSVLRTKLTELREMEGRWQKAQAELAEWAQKF